MKKHADNISRGRNNQKKIRNESIKKCAFLFKNIPKDVNIALNIIKINTVISILH